MRTLLCCLLLAGLALAPLRAMEVQPTTEDWKELAAVAKRTVAGFTAQITRQQAAIKYMEEHPHDDEFSGVVFLSDHEPSIEELKAVLAPIQQSLKEFTPINAVIQGLTTADHTRANYLNLRRQVRTYAYRYQQTEDDGRLGGAFGVHPDSVDVHPGIVPSPKTFPLAPLPKGLHFTWQDFPRIDGSTTAQPLAALIACRTLGLAAAWDTRRLYIRGQSPNTEEHILTPLCAESPDNGIAGNPWQGFGSSGLLLSCRLSGTPDAYTALIAGNSNCILVARSPSASELAAAKKAGVSLDVRPIALDAFIFLIHATNPVNTLTTAQIQSIYHGDVISWTELGGKAENLLALQREEHSGSQDTMATLVMQGQPMIAPIGTLIGYGMGGPYARLSTITAGIAYTFYYYHMFQSPDSTAYWLTQNGELLPEGAPPIRKICAVNGILPTPETIRNRTYPYVTEVYAVVRADEKPAGPALRLRDWLLTPEGQALIKESGYVPLPAP